MINTGGMDPTLPGSPRRSRSPLRRALLYLCETEIRLILLSLLLSLWFSSSR